MGSTNGNKPPKTSALDDIEILVPKEKIKNAVEYIENGDPLKDVLDDSEISQAIEMLYQYMSR